ncbi:hypothetical protein Pgin03_01112 [Porphyromonas gingivalis]
MIATFNYQNKCEFICQRFKIQIMRPLKNKEMEGRGVLGIKGASERGGSKE